MEGVAHRASRKLCPVVYNQLASIVMYSKSLSTSTIFAHTRNIDHVKFVNRRDMNGGRAILVDIISDAEIINGLWSCRLRQERCGGGAEGRALLRRARAGSREGVDGLNIDGR